MDEQGMKFATRECSTQAQAERAAKLAIELGVPYARAAGTTVLYTHGYPYKMDEAMRLEKKQVPH